MNTRLLYHVLADQEALLQRVKNIPEVLGSAEDVMIDDAAMTLLTREIDEVAKTLSRIQETVQQALA